MGHRLGPRPVRIVLMPGYDAAMLGRFAEQLVVPEPHRAAEQLAGGHRERRMPQQIVKAGRNPPSAQRMEQHGIGIVRFVGVVLVPQFASRMVRPKELGQLAAQGFDLFIRQNSNPGR